MLSGSEAINDAVRQSHMVACHFSVVPSNPADEVRFLAISGTYTQDRTSSTGSRLSLKIPLDGMVRADGTPSISPYGDRIKVWRGIIAPDGMAWTAQLGVFRVDSISLDYPTSSIDVEASSLMSMVVDSLFTQPRLIRNDADKAVVIRELITEATDGWSFRADETNSLGAIYNRSRVDAVNELATALGVDVGFNNVGQIRLKPTPTADDDVVWEINAGDDGVVVSYGTDFDRADSYNGVVAEGRSPYGRPIRYLATITNPDDPMRWGGPFGEIPIYYESELLRNVNDCQTAAEARLYDGVGKARRVEITCAAHSGLEAGDSVMLKTMGGNEVKVICDQIRMPLGPGPMDISGRVVAGWEYA